MFLFFYISSIKSAYFFVLSGIEVSRCDTRDDLIDRINSMDLSIQRLPEITIDEDLELDCNELPMFYFKTATLHRSNNFPSYSFSSNKTGGFATFTLDASTSSEDNCPGFTFSNINVVFKGQSLNTSIMSINNKVSITSDPGFQLHTTISEIPLNYLPVLQKLSFCRLTILPEVSDFMTDDFKYPDQLELSLNLKYAEAYMFRINIDRNTNVLFGNNQMIVDIIGKTKIIVYLPDVINYSNAFYFNIVSPDISFTISGDLSYTDEFPHYLYVIQVFDENTIAENINVTFNPGNYLSSHGTSFKTVMGELFSLSLFSGHLFWNNPSPLGKMTLSYVKLHLGCNLQIVSSPTDSSSFIFQGNDPIEGSLSINCDMVSIPEHLEPARGCTISITASKINSRTDFVGDLYVTSEITKSDISVTNLYFIDNPLITLSTSNKINAKRIEGKARIGVPTTAGAAGRLTEIICVEEIDSIKLDDYTIESNYADVFQLAISNNCLCVNKTRSYKSTTTNIPVTSENDESWKVTYESFHTTFTFSISTPRCVLDLTILAERTVPISLSFSASVDCDVEIKINQNAANFIGKITIANSKYKVNLIWLNYVDLFCEMTLSQSCQISSLFSGIGLTGIKSVTLTDFSQLTEIAPFSNNIQKIVLSTTTKIKSFTYTPTGWKYVTSTDEVFEIQGFRHNNLYMQYAQANKFDQTISIGLETSNPYNFVIFFDVTINVILNENDPWETANNNNFYPFFVISGTFTLSFPFETLPVIFDDSKFSDILIPSSSRTLLINRTSDRIQSIISVNSFFNLQCNSRIDVVQSSTPLYLEINNEAVIKSGQLTVSDKISLVFRDRLVINNIGLNRMWKESNSILMINGASLTSPSFLDDINIVWSFYGDILSRPSYVQNALNTNMFTFMFEDVSEKAVSNETDRFFNQPFQIANAMIDISCDELVSKVSFVDGKKYFSFQNKNISFEVVCTDLIYATNPVTFTVNGYVNSDFPSHIALFLNRTELNGDDGNNKSRDKKKLDPGVIAIIIIGAVLVIVIIVSLSVFLWNRRKHRIENTVD